ncbi:hypothetical protein K474DRAFT_1501310 [Panus rudis PR-1116 ss-1]|nr:hypothetical protein K474DRAFT_1501310 [Panus rudis PR-1116 ss-1]
MSSVPAGGPRQNVRDTTPQHQSLDNNFPEASVKSPADVAYISMIAQTRGMSVGPMPLGKMFDSFMPMPASFKPRTVPLDAFKKVRGARTEKEFEARFLACLKELKGFTEFEVVDCSNALDKFSGTLIRPDAAVYKKDKDKDNENEDENAGGENKDDNKDDNDGEDENDSENEDHHEKAKKKKAKKAKKAKQEAPPRVILLRWGKVELFFEFKRRSSHDPHRAGECGSVMLEAIDNAGAIKARGQIFTYLGAQMSRQPGRIFTFAVGIYGENARFYICDKSGVIVSVIIPYVDSPGLLMEFFQRFEQLSDEQRGLDTTIAPATEKERAVFEAAVSQQHMLERAGKSRTIPSAFPKYHSENEVYKVPVIDSESEQTKYFIIARPIRERLSPFAPGTQVYLALSLDGFDMDADVPEMKKLVNRLCFVKDLWRVGTAPAEIDVYRDLKKFKVPHIVPIEFGGDVKGPDGREQTTFVDVYARDHSKSVREWKVPCFPLDSRIRHRLVMKLGHPLASATSAKELVQVIRDALYCLIQAHNKSLILHRNINKENIMISPTKRTTGREKLARGILGGWENARYLGSTGVTQRTFSVSDAIGTSAACTLVLTYPATVYVAVCIGCPVEQLAQTSYGLR